MPSLGYGVYEGSSFYLGFQVKSTGLRWFAIVSMAEKNCIGPKVQCKVLVPRPLSCQGTWSKSSETIVIGCSPE